MKVSVIIPAFNEERHIGECLQSVCAQTFGDFEVIVVNDASSDLTPRIVEAAASRDSRVRLINLETSSGVSRARNIGIDIAKGDYVTFVDADDCLYADSLKTLVDVAEETGADVCVGGMSRGKRFVERPIRRVAYKTYGYEEAMRLALYQKIILNAPWGALIRRGLLSPDVRFREGIRYEDLDAFYRFYERANKIVYIPNALYFYRQNPRSFISHWSPARLDVLDVTDEIVRFFSERYPSLTAAAEDRRFSAHYNMMLLMKKSGVADADARERCLRVLRAGRKQALADPAVRLKNKIGALLLPLLVKYTNPK